MDPTKKKRVTKKAPPMPTGPIQTASQLKEALQASVIPRYSLEIQPNNGEYVMPQRVAFLDWVDRTFKRNDPESSQTRDCSGSGAAQDALTLFAHQRFIKDYLQAHSPYRGLLLYHGIGVGKSCSSIAAAEILMSSMKVVVLLPASLRDNYVGELKKCGNLFFGVREHHWVFVPKSAVDETALTMARINKEFVDEYKGIWVPLPNSKEASNWDSLTEPQKEVIRAQIDLMISHSVQFIHYNGLNTKALLDMTKNGRNPFDDKCVVIDEVHNLISMVSNNGKIGRAIYNLLMQAKNMKLILLSGTPIINYPHEVAYLLNLVTGPRKIYKAKAAKTSGFDSEVLQRTLESNSYVEWFELDINSKTIQWSLLPEGFKRTSATRVKHYADAPSHDTILQDLWGDLSQELRATRQTYTSQDAMTLPSQESDFNEYFVDFTANTVKNKVMFMRRILGTISFYSTYAPELYPTVAITETPLEMNDYQFNAYEKARAIERRMEKSGGKSNDANIFRSSGQVYRFYSRAICNFVFPEAIERPFPTSMSKMSKEVDDMDEDVFKTMEPEKADMARQYKARLNTAINNLIEGDYLLPSEVHKYSPKFKHIYDRIQSIRGCTLVYSQFRQVEGLGLFGEFLKKCGYAEFKVRWDGKDWDLDIAPEDMDKPKFMSFTGSNEETRVLLGIFNSTSIPPKIKERLGPKSSNKYGDIIKVLMITKSGAEGISLKNVRQVHVMEPYWNHIRIDQVIGRAVRTCSHIDLLESERKVDVFVYTMTPSTKQIQSSITLRRQDKSMTSDQFIYDLAKRKAKIIGEFLQCMQKASVDCALNAKKHGNVKCFAYPVNADPSKNTFQPTITMDVQDEQYQNEVQTLDWRGRVLETKKGRFLIRPETLEVYDYELYEYSGRLVLLGHISEDMSKLTLNHA